MKKIFIILCTLISFNAWAQIYISPQTQEELDGIINSLAKDHAYPQWCEKSCAQITIFKLSGELASGELAVRIDGNVVGSKQGVLPLFGAVPAVDILSLKNDRGDVPLIFFEKSFYTFLSPGPFHLTGIMRVKGGATNFVLPASVGQVVLDIPDQEKLLSEVKLGQVGGSFQLVPASLGKKGVQKQSLRLEITRSFEINREKNFVYTIHVVGAKPGQIINFPISNREKILKNPGNAKVFADRIDFTAGLTEQSFQVEGEWLAKEIKLTALSGAVRETWRLRCEGAFDCAFTGDVEKSRLGNEHIFLPISGQTLEVTWKELGLLAGQHLVVQTALLDSKKTGDGLKQNLFLQVTSSAANSLYLTLPREAIPQELQYNGEDAPVLKNEKGDIHLTLPQGETRVDLSWEIAKLKGVKIPTPIIPVPVGKWLFWFSPHQNEEVLYAGGLSGSPVVLFWPRLVFTLTLGLIFVYAEKKILKKGETRATPFLILCSGFALVNPISFMSVIAFLLVLRWFSHITVQRSLLSWFFEVTLVVAAVVFFVGSFINLLDTAFLKARILDFQDFCSTAQHFSRYKPYDALCWEVKLANPQTAVGSPYELVISELTIHIFYIFWALVSGFYVFSEFKKFVWALKEYFSRGYKPLRRQKEGVMYNRR